MEVKTVRSENDFKKLYPIIRELRPELEWNDYINIIIEAEKRDEYQLVGFFENEVCIAAMGFRILFDFVHGKHLYIDDLVVTEQFRSQGIGAKLLQHAEDLAKEKNCKGLRLCTGIDREEAKRFYLKNNWSARAIAFKKKL